MFFLKQLTDLVGGSAPLRRILQMRVWKDVARRDGPGKGRGAGARAGAGAGTDVPNMLGGQQTGTRRKRSNAGQTMMMRPSWNETIASVRRLPGYSQGTLPHRFKLHKRPYTSPMRKSKPQRRTQLGKAVPYEMLKHASTHSLRKQLRQSQKISRAIEEREMELMRSVTRDIE